MTNMTVLDLLQCCFWAFGVKCPTCEQAPEQIAGQIAQASLDMTDLYDRMVKALTLHGDRIRSEVIEECACFVQSHPSYKAIDIANGLRALKEEK
jgi:hypothetical protein